MQGSVFVAAWSPSFFFNSKACCFEDGHHNDCHHCSNPLRDMACVIGVCMTCMHEGVHITLSEQ